VTVKISKILLTSKFFSRCYKNLFNSLFKDNFLILHFPCFDLIGVILIFYILPCKNFQVYINDFPSFDEFNFYNSYKWNKILIFIQTLRILSQDANYKQSIQFKTIVFIINYTMNPSKIIRIVKKNCNKKSI